MHLFNPPFNEMMKTISHLLEYLVNSVINEQAFGQNVFHGVGGGFVIFYLNRKYDACNCLSQSKT